MNVDNLLLGPLASKVVGSIVLLILVVAVRTLLARVAIHHLEHGEIRRRWLVSIRNFALFALLLGLVSIWADALRSFALSVAAVGVAFVVAMKEFLLCLNGSVLRAVTHAYSIGDRIEIGSHRGDVIDLSLLTTTLLEVGPGRQSHRRTGRKIVLPNSQLLESAVINESYTGQYVIHMFSLPLGTDQDWQAAERILLESARAECEPFLAEAEEYVKRMERRHGLESPSLEPRVSLQISEPGRLTLFVRVPAPVGTQGRLEETILRRFLAKFDIAGKVSQQPPLDQPH